MLLMFHDITSTLIPNQKLNLLAIGMFNSTIGSIVENCLLLCKMILASIRTSNYQEIILALHENHGHFDYSGFRHRMFLSIIEIT